MHAESSGSNYQSVSGLSIVALQYSLQTSVGSATDSLYHAVSPQVSLTISQPVAKLGSSVSIVCTAKSYPPANDTSFFHLSSPHDPNFSSNQSAAVGTGVEYHINHVTRSDGGEYGCVVIIEGYPQALQSNTVKQNLTVYGKS